MSPTGTVTGRRRHLAVPLGIGTIAIPTRDRRQSLGRALRSYAENARDNGRLPELVVADDSSGAATREQVRGDLRALGRRYGLRCWYIGLEEKKRYVGLLASAARVSRRAVEFALLNPEGCSVTPGANRNCLLLHTAGATFFGPDDDTRGIVVRPPMDREGIAFRGRCQVAECWPFASRAEAMRHAHKVQVDILGVLEGVLGRVWEADATAASGGESSRFEVRVAELGTLGTGIDNPEYYVTRFGPSRSRVLASRERFLRYLSSRQMLHVAAQPTVTLTSPWNTCALAYDNRNALPPFPPVLRGEDGVFGCTLSLCVPTAAMAYLPWAVLHLPPVTRGFSEADLLRRVSGVRAERLFLECLSAAEIPSSVREPEERLRRLGVFLERIGHLSERKLRAWLGDRQRRFDESRLAFFEWLGREFVESPAFWAQLCRHRNHGLRTAMRRPDYFAPTDLGGRRDPAAALRRLRRLIRGHGVVLQVWTDMVEAAKRLRTQGVMIGQLL
jgi:hypothetical protein